MAPLSKLEHINVPHLTESVGDLNLSLAANKYLEKELSASLFTSFDFRTPHKGLLRDSAIEGHA